MPWHYEMRRADSLSLGRLKPRDLGLQLEVQLSGLLIGKPIRHLRKDGAIERGLARVTRQLLRRARLG